MPAPRRSHLAARMLVLALLALTSTAATAQTSHFSRIYGDNGNDEGYSLVRSDNGDIYVTGSFTGNLDLGGETLSAVGLTDVFVARFDPEGGHIWSLSFGSTGVDGGRGIDVNDFGEIYVGAQVGGAVTLDGTTYPALGSLDAFLAAFDEAGQPLWARMMGGPFEDRINAVAAHTGRVVVVTGQFQGPASFGGSGFNFGMGHSMFLAMYDDVGGYAWSRAAAPTGTLYSSYGYGVAVRDDGRIWVTGTASHGVDLGGGPLVVSGSQDAFLALYTAAGTHAASTLLGSFGIETGADVAAGPGSSALLVGGFTGTVDFGGGPVNSAGGSDIFLARFDAGLAHVWSAGFGDASDQFATGVDVLGESVALTGQFEGSLDLGGGTFESGGPDPDGFVAVFDALGVHQWSHGYGNDESLVYGHEVAAAPDARAWVTGGAVGSVDFGGGVLTTSAGSYDAYLALFGPVEVTAVAALPPAMVMGAPTPNPFNPSTRLAFSLARAGTVALTVHDLSGARVRTLYAGPLPGGDHTYAWDGRDDGGRGVASGVYHFRLETVAGAQTRKAVLLK